MKLPRAVHGVVFDMDGLLVDTEVLIRDLMMEAAPRYGAELPHHVFIRMVGLPSAESDKVAQAHFGADFPLTTYFEEIEEKIHEACRAGVALKAGVREILD